LRCRVVLACAAGATTTQVAAELGCRCRRWASGGRGSWPAGWRLVDEPRPGAPRTITDEQVEAVIVATLEETPPDATHWSRASMAKRSGLSKSTVGGSGRRFGSSRTGARVQAIQRSAVRWEGPRRGGVVPGPPERALVRCVDEKSQVPALDRSQPVLAMLPGMPERRTHDSTRNGVTSPFAALDIATGQ